MLPSILNWQSKIRTEQLPSHAVNNSTTSKIAALSVVIPSSVITVYTAIKLYRNHKNNSKQTNPQPQQQNLQPQRSVETTANDGLETEETLLSPKRPPTPLNTPEASPKSNPVTSQLNEPVIELLSEALLNLNENPNQTVGVASQEQFTSTPEILLDISPKVKTQESPNREELEERNTGKLEIKINTQTKKVSFQINPTKQSEVERTSPTKTFDSEQSSEANQVASELETSTTYQQSYTPTRSSLKGSKGPRSPSLQAKNRTPQPLNFSEGIIPILQGTPLAPSVKKSPQESFQLENLIEDFATYRFPDLDI